jgi:hypothetical protein
MGRVGIAAALCLIWLAPGSGAAAQNATPIGSAPVCVAVATPAVDAVMQEAYGTVIPAGTPDTVPPIAAETLPQGEPANAEMVAAADQVVQTWLSCYLSNEPLAVLALQSDQMDREFVGQYGQNPDAFQNMLDTDVQSTPVPLDPETVISAGHDIRVLDDGRIGGIWSLDGDAAFILLTQEDGRWVLDDIIDIIDEATPTT